MPFTMSKAERERFLAAPHVGVLAVDSGTGPDRGPLAVPVWYSYVPGGLLTVITGRDSVKARRIRTAGRFTLCAQHEQHPAAYVSVEGPVVAVEERLDPDEWAALANRYLSPGAARDYLASAREQLAADITLRMRPEHWSSADFSTFGADLPQDR
ncbi:pyridoxamine 5'-phosphate oxidase family protein [Kitasatospora sp. NPDC094016]|uniref:pyridoxamine 5'-phosphate oxidase family protein n=1 Tax=Kitasatospora sp. NPDC094016 TaxID=3154986 RepID=UPI003318A3BB